MSSSDWSLLATLRRVAVATAVLSLPLASACTVRPLYSNPASGTAQGMVTADLSSISIKPVEQRYAQQVRNHLIFLFNHGAGQPAAPKYTMTLVVAARHQSGAVVQIGDDNEPTAGTVTMTANYSLTGIDGKDIVASGRRQISSAYDVPREEFAAYRARLDAENRAARELAELLNIAVAQDLSK